MAFRTSYHDSQGRMEDESIWQQEWTTAKSKLYQLRKDKGRSRQQIEENNKKTREMFFRK